MKLHGLRDYKISKLIRNDDEVVYGDSGYLGAAEQEAIKSNESFSKIEFRINKRPSSLKIKDCYEGENWDKCIERSKSSVRSKVEHPYLIVKRYFGYWKVAYKGIAKNMNRFHILFACANPVMCIRAKRSLATLGEKSIPYAFASSRGEGAKIRELLYSSFP